jgi:hypothetical protein
VQRLFWFHWRDPRSARPGTCSFCGSAGLLSHNRTAKPSLAVFKSFTADITPPTATIWSGPRQGTAIRNSTPTLKFRSSESGSTFKCSFGGNAYTPCTTPSTPSTPLSDGLQRFGVRALDAAGNLGPIVTRSFTVDTVPPKVSVSSGPANGSTSHNHTPSFQFTASEAGVKFQGQLDGGGFAACTSPFSPSPLADGQHSFQVMATDRAGNVGPTVTRSWTLEPAAP